MDIKVPISKMSGADLEQHIKELALSVKPEKFEDICNDIQLFLDEQNLRARTIAKKYKKFHDNRTVADVFKHYWLSIQVERSKGEN